MHAQGQSIVVRHKEFLCPVYGSKDFVVQNDFVLNPGLSETFPWLSRVASCFQEYTILGAVFHYVPTSGTAVSGTNPAIGSVMLQTSYRATEDSPSSKVEMMNEYWASEIPPNETGVHPIECSPKENPFKVQYVRTVPSSTDSPLLYDLGKTFLATQGMPADGNPVGDLWITYEIELRKPVVKSNVSPGTYTAYGATNVGSVADPFTTMVWDPNTSVQSAGKTITFMAMPAGLYWLELAVEVPGGGSLTAADLQTGYTSVGGQIANIRRTYLAGTAPTLNVAFVAFDLTVSQSANVSVTCPTFTLSPSTGLRFVVRVMTNTVP